MGKKYFIIVSLLLLIISPCPAITITVDDDGPADFDNIQEAIILSSDNDIVLVEPGIYYENILFFGKSITLTSKNPNDPNIIASTIIDGRGLDSVVTFAWNEDSNSVITGFKITNGDALYGGGILCWGGASPKIENCLVTSNTAYQGGGIYGDSGEPIILGCEVSGNTSEHDGGGIYGCNGEIRDCIISSNTAGYHGGGLCLCHGEINNCIIAKNWSLNNNSGGGLASCNGSIVNCRIIENNSSCYGGGLSSCNAEIYNSIISGNWSEDGGGGIYQGEGKLVNCTISNNISLMSGGGLRSCQAEIISCAIIGNSGRYGGGLTSCNVEISDCIISKNVAKRGGGGIQGCDAIIEFCAITENSAADNGGGISDCGGRITNCIISGNVSNDNGGGINSSDVSKNPTISLCTIVGNRANLGGGIYFGEDSPESIQVTNNIICNNDGGYGIYWKYTTPKDLTYNNVWGNEDGNYGGWAGPGIECISEDPHFANPGYWDPNDTIYIPDDDIWFEGDYHLKSEAGRWDPNSYKWVVDEVTSPCIDTGDPTSIWSAELWPHGKRINMGAFGGTSEASISLSQVGHIADFNNDGIVNIIDYSQLANKWQIEQPLFMEDLDRNGVVDNIDLNLFVQYWLWQE